MLNHFDLKASLTKQIRRYIDYHHLELEHRGEPGTVPNFNVCVLLVGIGNYGAKTVSQVMRQFTRLGIPSNYYACLALVDDHFSERDHQVEYMVINDHKIDRNKIQEKLLEEKNVLIETLKTLNTRLAKVMERTGSNIKIYVVSDLSEDLFASSSMILCLLEDQLNSFFVANTGIEFTGLFFQSAMLRTKREQANIFVAWQEIESMSSPDFNFNIDMANLMGQSMYRISRQKPIFAISYLYSDFNENSSPILKTDEEDYCAAEMLATLIYLKSSSQFNEARVFNSLQMPSPTVANGLPRYAAIGYSIKSIKISPIFSYTCWYLLNKIVHTNMSKAGYLIQDWESVLNELEIDSSGIEALSSEVYSSVNEALKEIEELHIHLEKEVHKELLAETLETAEKLLVGKDVEIIFEERIAKAAKQITKEYLPKQLQNFKKILIAYLQNERRGLFFVKCLLKSDEGNIKLSLIKYLELKINKFMIQSDALRLRADRASRLALSRLEIEPDKKGLLGLGYRKNNFLKRLIEVKYQLLQRAVVYDQLREIFKAYLVYTRDLNDILLDQEANILRLEKALKDINNAERKKLVAAGEDGLLDLIKGRFNDNKEDEIANETLATIFRDADDSILYEKDHFFEVFVKVLFDHTQQFLRQTNLQTLSLEQLLESLAQTHPAKGTQILEDLYVKCKLTLSLNKSIISRQTETHYYFFSYEGNSSLRSTIKGLFQGKLNDVLLVDYDAIKSICMLKACFGFDIKDIYFYRNYKDAYGMFESN